MDLEERITGVAALAEPVRREVYLFVAGQDEPVSRDDAATGVGIARHTAKFHLDRLVADGLLEATFRRLTGRSGPGAGRPAKLYRRASREVAVSLPERHYDLAGTLMAEAIDRAAADGTPVVQALREAATACGAAVGRERTAADPAPVAPEEPAPGPLAAAAAALACLGYEPRVVGSQVVLANCPFRALARDHTALVCGMNLALLGGLAAELGEVEVRLEPAEGRCCVVLSG